ncbi:MAG: hypothetical protein JNL74_10060, partial [Fibrobacteres bacterium]|nr:hypothetical protein [Fibrobacterota bacterium]
MNIFIAVLIVFLSLVSLSCDSERYISAREKPLPPQLIELMPGTKNDTLPAIIVKFSHTDTLPASIMVESAESDTVFSLEVFDIPPTFGKYASPIIDQLSGNQTLSRFFFRAYAASRKGIISDPSDTLTIQLLDK